jgi:ABC-type multidrug transport system fused ATPase/permease subunit
MSLIFHFIKEFLWSEKNSTICILTLGLITNIIQTIGFTKITANILSELQSKHFSKAYVWFWSFIYLSLIYVGISYIYRTFQLKVVSKLNHWTRFQLVRMLLVTNDEEFTNENFPKMISPINRVASHTNTVLNDMLTYYVPNIIFLLVSIGYISYQHISIGAVFILGNITWMTYLYFNWNPLVKNNKEYEIQTTHTEGYLVEMLNNMDKIITRGQTLSELSIFSEKKDLTIEKAYSYVTNLDNNMVVVNTIILITTLSCIGIGIKLYRQGHFNHIAFVTFFTILLMYRDRAVNTLSILPELIETMGKSKSLAMLLGDIKDKYDLTTSKTFIDYDLTFEDLVLDNICFGYNDTLIFKDYNIHIQTTNHKIIGITGPSGKGKSTMCKIFLKMYKCSQGNILIDGINIDDIDPLYIRTNITYVNQNAKLFDRKVLENILFGCSDEEICQDKYKIIMSYPNIQKLFEGIDMEESDCGPLGEKLSGGQRQVVNIISGLVNPSRILILDEPTNALNKTLKTELLAIIKRFKMEKQTIIIITHDKDVYPLFDEQIEI